MSFSPAPRHRLFDVILTPFSDQLASLSYPNPTAPFSGTMSGSVAVFCPIYLLEPFTVAKAFWCNGATVGTDSLDLGVYQMTDQATGRLDLIRSTGAVLSAGTASVVQAVSAWKVARANLTSGSSSTDATSYTTASVTLKAKRLYLLSVTNSKAALPDAISSIDNGPAFTSEKTVGFNLAAAATQRLTVLRAVPTVDYTGTLVINFGANTQTGACWSLDEMSGVDTTTNQGVVQSVSNTADVATSVTATLAAFGSANNATFGASAKGSAGGFTPGAGFTELADVNTATPAQALETEWTVANDTTVDQSWSGNIGAAVIGLELKADASAFIIPASTPGNPAIYMGMTVSGTTATILRTASSQWGAAAGWLEKTSTFPLPSSLIAAVLSSARSRPLAGFSLRTLLD